MNSAVKAVPPKDISHCSHTGGSVEQRDEGKQDVAAWFQHFNTAFPKVLRLGDYVTLSQKENSEFRSLSSHHYAETI